MLESKLYKSIMAFNKKKSLVMDEISKYGPLENIDKKKLRIERQLTNPVDLS